MLTKNSRYLSGGEIVFMYLLLRNSGDKIIKQISTLSDFLKIGTMLSSIINMETGYRFLVCGNYTAFYRYVDNTVFVDRILYGKRDFMRILF